MNDRTKKRWWPLASLALAGGVVLLLLVTAFLETLRSDIGRVRRLPDGSTLSLRQVAFVATNSFTYSHRPGGPLARLLAPVLPNWARSRLGLLGGGGFGFSLEGTTNLLVVTVNRTAGSRQGSAIGRLCLFDDDGDVYDACWGANTLGMPDETVDGWQARAFPRRCRTIGLRFLATTETGAWTNAAEFEINNPFHAVYPQWQPERLPATKTNGNLSVTLREFQSGGRMADRPGGGDPKTAARKTRLVFSFAEDKADTENWRVQKLTLSDATGNNWFPYLDLAKQNLNWAQGGTVEFFGALWPSEQAWKLDVEVVRTSGFRREELWETTVVLPGPRMVSNLTNRWDYDGRSLRLMSLASPNTDHPGDLKWTAKWWGEDKDHVYSLALVLGGDQKGTRISVVGAVDQNGTTVNIVQHGSQDYATQAVFFTPGPDATKVRFTFASQRSRFVQFLARPEFVKDTGLEHEPGTSGKE